MDSEMDSCGNVFPMVCPRVVNNRADVPFTDVEDVGCLHVSGVFRLPTPLVFGPFNPRADAEHQTTPWIDGSKSHERVVLMLGEDHHATDTKRKV